LCVNNKLLSTNIVLPHFKQLITSLNQSASEARAAVAAFTQPRTAKPATAASASAQCAQQILQQHSPLRPPSFGVAIG